MGSDQAKQIYFFLLFFVDVVVVIVIFTIINFNAAVTASSFLANWRTDERFGENNNIRSMTMAHKNTKINTPRSIYIKKRKREKKQQRNHIKICDYEFRCAHVNVFVRLRAFPQL